MRLHSEKALLERVAHGDEAAIIELYEQHKTAVYTFVYYRVGGDQALAEDITAEVFLRLVAQLPHLVSQERPLLAWLYTVARHCVVDHYRHNGRFDHQPLPDQLPTNAPGPEQQAHLSLEKRQLLTALARLPDAQRDVLILRFIAGHSVAETAHLLDKKEGAVKTLTRRALAAMRRQFNWTPDYEQA